MIYIDTSALLRLVFPDETTPAVQRLLEPGTHLVSSVLLRIEARRATMRRAPRRMPRVELLLDRVDTVAIDDAVVELAGRVPGSVLRSLDAIHLATTLLIRDEVESLVTYDARLADAARAHDLAVVMPA